MNKTPLKTIVYLSTASNLMMKSDLEDLLIKARRANQASSVSGILLYADGIFMQCIEGEPAAVSSTYERILASRRHRKIHVLLNDDAIGDRSFSDWAMGFARPTCSKLFELSNAEWHCKLQSGNASLGFMLLCGFWHAHQDPSPRTDWRLYRASDSMPSSSV